MAGAAVGLATRFLAPLAAQAVGSFAQGKMGEMIGDRNLSEAEKLRERNRAQLEDPDVMGNRSATSTGNALDGSNQRSMGREAFLNQMTQANKRADNEDQRATYDQADNFQRGQTLANNYANTAIRQAESNNSVLATMLGIGGTARR